MLKSSKVYQSVSFLTNKHFIPWYCKNAKPKIAYFFVENFNHFYLLFIEQFVNFAYKAFYIRENKFSYT